MSEPKTRPTDVDVTTFIAQVEPAARRDDVMKLLEIMREITGEEARMWGSSIIGFGSYHFKYESGREGDWMLTGFSPRKASLTLYVLSGFEQQSELLARLGKHSTGKGCLYIKRLSDIDESVLRDMISASVRHMRETNQH